MHAIIILGNTMKTTTTTKLMKVNQLIDMVDDIYPDVPTTEVKPVGLKWSELIKLMEDN